jgi:hypothetical protein
MSETAEKSGEGNHVKLILLGLAAAAQVVPGYQLLAGDDWQPSGMTAEFALGASVVSAAALGVLFVARHRVLRLRTRTVLALFVAAVALSLSLALVYRSVLKTRSVSYLYGKQTYGELVPFGTSRWVDTTFLRRIRTANFGADPPASAAEVTPTHLRRTLERYGPGTVRGEVPATWRLFTATAMWLNYMTLIGLAVAAFGMIAMRLPPGLVYQQPSGTGGAAAEGTSAAPEAPPTDAPAAVSSEQRIAELEAELRRVRASLPHTNSTAASHNGRPDSPLVVRAEIRTSGWLLLGAAAMVWWINRREEPEESHRSTHSTLRNRGR